MLGPGLIAGCADDDPSGIGTYAQAGAQFGFGMLWMMLFTYPLMVAVQLISAQVGRVTGQGLAANLSRHLPRSFVVPLLLVLLVINTINIGADLAAMGASAALLLPGPPVVYAIALGAVSLGMELFVPYSRHVTVLKWITLSLFSYLGTALVVKVPWGTVAWNTLVPQLRWDRDFALTVVAVMGTTISPYLFFWQSSLEVEEQEATPGEEPIKNAPAQAEAQFAKIRFDTFFGMAVSNLVAFFVMLTAAMALHAHGVHDIDSTAQAAKALEPVAGKFASALFALGLVGAGLLAVPVLAGSAAYALAEAFGWRKGLERRPAAAPRFYGVVGVATLIGMAINFLHINPMKALYWTAVLSGVIAVPILFAMMVVASRHAVMARFVIARPLRVLGWLTTLLMSCCLVVMAVV
jgi:NRAMP (natural resistance-associated macrophage protein)-like metal ion transporter